MNWEILSRRAKRAISIARKEAESKNLHFLYPEHLCIGLIRADKDIHHEICSFSIEISSLYEVLHRVVKEKEKMNRKDTSQKTDNEIILSDEVKSVLETAAKKSQEEFSGKISTETIFRSLFEDSSNSLHAVFFEYSIDPNVLLDKVKLRKTFIFSHSTDKPDKNQEVTFPSFQQVSTSPLPSSVDLPLIDVTKQAENGELDVVIGREAETDRVLQILSRKKKNNPIIVGDPGVGKTAIVEALAQRIVSQKVPGAYRNQKILLLDICAMLSGTKFRGDMEEKIQQLFSYIEKEGNIILFIDEIHYLLRNGKSENNHLIQGLFRPYLQSSKTRIISTCDLQVYRKKIESDASLFRVFQPIFIDEPSPDQTYHILEGIRPSFEKHHLIHISDEAIRASVQLSSTYISGRYQPDQAIDLLDETCAHFCFEKQIPPDSLMEARKEWDTIQKASKEYVMGTNCVSGVSSSDIERVYVRLQKEMKNWEQEAPSYVVSANDVAQVVSAWTGIPLGQLLETEKEKLRHIEAEMQKKIIGQDKAVNSLANALRRSRMGIRDSHKPTGVFLFLGPTGVGKTETARILAEYLFGSREHMIRFDMSEYMEKHTVSRLIGAPPGYIGYEEGGQLTELIKHKPYSILLFDEIEKAHPDIFNIWLQLFDDGRLTDSRGFTVDCSHCIVVLTSNLVHHSEDGVLQLGFSDSSDVVKTENLFLGNQLSSTVIEKLQKYFRPELLNRLDEIIVFNTLSHEHLLEIVKIMIQQIRDDLVDYKIGLEVTQKAQSMLVEEGYSREFGARPLKRVLQKRIADEISSAFITNVLNNNDVLEIDWYDSAYHYTVKTS